MRVETETISYHLKVVTQCVMIMCRLKRALQNGTRLPGRLREQFQEEKMVEIVTSKISVEVQRYTFRYL